MFIRFIQAASIAIAVIAIAAPSIQANRDDDQQRLCSQLGGIVSSSDAVMVTGPNGRVLCALNADQPLVPASILKIVTAMAALHHLGPASRFATEFYLRGDADLLIKGYGDPLLVSEQVDQIAQRLATKVTRIRKLILDDSYFTYPLAIPGRGTSTEPYDAPNGALCVNFNTVFFKKEKGQWASAEPQTPLLPVAIPKISASGLVEGRITLAANRREGLRYAGELFQYFFKRAGIQIDDGLTFGMVDDQQDRLIWRYLSDKELTEVISDLLEFSNNFIANQLLLSLGAKVHGPPATVEKGVAVLQSYYHSTLGLKRGQVVEASGISRQNRLPATAMMHILGRFEPYHKLMRHEGRQWYKTGHLKGVRTRAGYLEAAQGGFYRFVVLINSPGKSTNQIMKLLERNLK